MAIVLLLILSVVILDRLVLRRRRQARQVPAGPDATSKARVQGAVPGVQDTASEVQDATSKVQGVQDTTSKVQGAVPVVPITTSKVQDAASEVQGTPPQVPEAESDPGTLDLIGRRLGSYEVQEKIGVGGMAIVYKGYHAQLDRYVAIKVLGRPFLEAADADVSRRFQREARTVAALRHPHIVQVFDYGDVDGTHYLVMEYVEGTDLRQSMKLRKVARRAWTPGEILDVLDPISQALDYAHAQGIVHRDIKPANVLISTSGDHFLTDFGLSAIRKSRTTLISTLGQPFGTPEYIAPEQAEDYSSAGPRSDIYSLGCVAYELITGHLPFEGDSPLSIALMHLSADPMPPSIYVPDLPPAVDAVVLRALDKEPQRRFRTATAMVQALRKAWTLPLPDPATPSKSEIDDTNGFHVAARVLAAETDEAEPDDETSKPRAEEIDLTPSQARLVLWSIERNKGRLSRANVQKQLGLTERPARTLIEDWLERGWLVRSTKPRQPATVSTELARQARIRLGRE